MSVYALRQRTLVDVEGVLDEALVGLDEAQLAPRTGNQVGALCLLGQIERVENTFPSACPVGNAAKKLSP
jgi:hypothetical protein